MNRKKRVETITKVVTNQECQNHRQALSQMKRLVTMRNSKPQGLKVGINTKGCSGLSYTLEYVDKIEEYGNVNIIYVG